MGFRKFKSDCSICLSSKNVAIYDLDENGLTFCPDCCAKTEKPNGEEGHEFEYVREERGRFCKWCHEPVPLDYYFDEAP